LPAARHDSPSLLPFLQVPLERFHHRCRSPASSPLRACRLLWPLCWRPAEVVVSSRFLPHGGRGPVTCYAAHSPFACLLCVLASSPPETWGSPSWPGSIYSKA
jgi:hypothetical protein